MSDEDAYRERTIAACIRWLTGPQDWGQGYYGNFHASNPHGAWIPTRETYPPEIVDEAVRRLADEARRAAQQAGSAGAG